MKTKLFAISGLLFLFGCPQEGGQTQPQQQQPQQAQPAQPAQQAQTQAAQQPAEQQAQPTQVAANGNDEGKKLFLMGCANCHGPDGTGAMMRAMMPKIGDLTSPELHSRMKDADITTLITTGRDKMPPFGGVFNVIALSPVRAGA